MGDVAVGRPSFPQFDSEYDQYKMRQLVDELIRWINTVEAATGSGGGGVPPVETVHNALLGRDAADAHPQTAITGLTSALAAINFQALINTTNISVNSAGITTNANAITALDVRVTANTTELDLARTQRYFFGE